MESAEFLLVEYRIAWAQESEIQLKESGIPLKIQVQVALTRNLNKVPGMRNSERGIQKLRLSWITSYEAIGSF